LVFKFACDNDLWLWAELLGFVWLVLIMLIVDFGLVKIELGTNYTQLYLMKKITYVGLGLVLIEIITIWFWKLLIFGPGGWSASYRKVLSGAVSDMLASISKGVDWSWLYVNWSHKCYLSRLLYFTSRINSTSIFIISAILKSTLSYVKQSSK
jgi:hypothetical protein